MPVIAPTDRPAPRRQLGRAVLGLTLGAGAAALVSPELFGLAGTLPFVQLVAFRPAVATGLLAAGAIAVLVRRRWWPVALLPALVAACAWGAITPRVVTGPDAPPGRPLTVLSFNVLEGSADPTTLAATIRADQPDLVVLPEAGYQFEQRLSRLVADLGYHSWSTTPEGEPDRTGIVVFAAAGLGPLTATPLELGTEFRWLRLSGGTLGNTDVVAVHTAAPVPALMSAWSDELGQLRRWCADGRGAHIVVGDVNATLDHAALRSAITGCTDAAADRGEGLVATWPTGWPRWLGAQIDHVFTVGGPRATDVQVLDLPGSDHRALLTHLVLRPH